MSNCPETGLPFGNQKPALALPHFPTRWQAVLWRNWGLVTSARLARVLKTDEKNILDAAAAMGLGMGADQETERLWLKRGYITLIRQNWHLLPYSQLLQLIDRTPEQVAYALKEDDFLWNKLGGFKPATTKVAWSPLKPKEMKQTANIRLLILKHFGHLNTPPAEKPFEFISKYGRLASLKTGSSRAAHFKLNYVYSYSAVYGDPLLDPELDPYPDGMLSDLAANGVNGIWLQGVLYTLVPWFGDTPYSKGHAQRITNLNRLIARAKQHGIGVFLYLNEPRAMPPEFFAKRPRWRGSYSQHSNLHAMCISTPEVLECLRDGVCDLFRKAPELAGVFTITMSENLTHCRSKANSKDFPPCPRCINLTKADMVAAVNNAIAEGAHRAKSSAKVIAWDWAWNPDWAANAVLKLRPDIMMMCHSEAWLQTEADGVRGRVAEYSMSKVGPGFQAEELWQIAKTRGMKCLAKIQMNNTWECSAVPYLPVPFLVKEHLRNLEKRGISGLMSAWTLGGYPGGNLLLAKMEPEELAKAQFGPAAKNVIKAWKIFSEAFKHFPTHGASMLYRGPQNYGPMNLLYAKHTDYQSTMVGFPYDDLKAWRGILFPPDLFEEEFRILSEGWQNGVKLLRRTERSVPQKYRENFSDLMNVAEAAYCHFRSSYLQMKFIRLRDETRSLSNLKQMLAILDEEIVMAKKLFEIVRRDSRIGFEASNHYYYTEQSLKEKVLNCELLQETLAK